jgi:hypothetical protein
VTEAAIPVERRPYPIDRTLAQNIGGTSGARLARLLAKVDAMNRRGAADPLIAPLRLRLSTLQRPRPLRFAGVLCYPLECLIVPSTRWRPGDNAIPRNALTRMADHIRRTMSDRITAIEVQIAGRTRTDIDHIMRLGQSLWPDVAHILRTSGIPETWDSSGLSDMTYRPLADAVAALLDQAGPLDSLCADTANGFIPLNPDRVAAMLGRVAAVSQTALPMLIAMLLARVPEAAAVVPVSAAGLRTASIQTALERAADRLLLNLDEEAGIEAQLAAGSLAQTAASIARITALLRQFDTVSASPQRRARLRSIRQRLGACCQDCFTKALQGDFLAPLHARANALSGNRDPAVIRDMEAAARSLRVLQMEARAVGNGPVYDSLLNETAEAVKDVAMGDRMTRVDRVRLVELLVGPEAALAMLDLGSAF